MSDTEKSHRASRRREGFRALMPAPEARIGTFFIGFVLALVPGVAGTLWAITYLADNISQLANIALLAILTVSLIGVLFFVFQARIFRWFGLGVRGRLSDVAGPVSDLVRGAMDGDITVVGDALQIAGERAAAWWSWWSMRKWIIGICIAMMAGFAALIGSALLQEQNQLIKQQNEYFRTQNAQIRTEIEMNAQVARSLRRSQLIATLYDRQSCGAPACAYVASLRSRAEAFRALLDLDRDARTPTSLTPVVSLTSPSSAVLATPLGVTIGRDYANVDLRWANLRGLDLQGVSLRDADLRGADLSGVDLSGADLLGARLSTADLFRADLSGARIDDVDLQYATLTGARFTDTTIDPVGLIGARVDGLTTLPGLPEGSEVPATKRVGGAVVCTTCCVSYEAGQVAAAGWSTGEPTPTELRELDELFDVLGLGRDRNRGSHSGGRRLAEGLFAGQPGARKLLRKVAGLADDVRRAGSRPRDAFLLGVYVAYMQTRPDAAAAFAIDSLERVVGSIVGATGRVGTAAQWRALGAAQAGNRHVDAALDAYDRAVRIALGCGI